MANRKQYEVALAIGGKVQSSLGRAVGSANRQLQGLRNGIKAMAGLAAGYMSISALKNFAKESVAAAKEQIEAETKLEAVLKNVKSIQAQGPDAYRKAKVELVEMASKLQQVGVIGDEVTIAGMQQLATFQMSQKEIGILSSGMTDLLAQQKGLNATQGDAVGIANMIGKVMDGQVGALRRVGISFTKAQEHALKTGDRMKKAAVLAEVLKNNVGGVNAALAQTDQGRIQQMNNAWGDMKEVIGMKILPLQAKFAGWFAARIPGIQSGIVKTFDFFSVGVSLMKKSFEKVKPYTDILVRKIKELKPAFMEAFGIAKQTVIPVVERLSQAFKDVFLNKVAMAKSQLVTISKMFSSVWPYIKKLGLSVINFGLVLKNAFMKIIPAVAGFVKSFDETLMKIWPVVLSIFEFIGKKIVPIVAEVFDFLGREAIPMAAGAISEWVAKIAKWLPKIGTIIQNVWNIIKPVLNIAVAYIQYMFPFIKGIILAAMTTIKGIIGGLIQSLGGIISFINGVFSGNWKEAWQGVKDIFGGIFSSLGALLKTPLNVISGMINGVIEHINKLDIKIPDWVPGLGGKGFKVNISKFPMLANGGYIKHRPGGIIANIGEGREDEVVSPLSKLERMFGAKKKGSRGGQPVQYNFNPTYIVQGDADEKTLKKVSKQSQVDFERRMKDIEAKRRRLSLSPA